MPFTFSRFILGVALAFAPCGVFATDLARPAHAAPAASSVVPYETLATGLQSGCEKRALFTIDNQTEWQRVWGVHTQGHSDAAPLPKVNFERQIVLAVLSGRQETDGKSLQIAQIVRTETDTKVFFMAAPDADAKTGNAPYLFALIDKPITPLHWIDVFKAQCARCVP